MAEKSSCEEVEIAIYSDAELTQEQKNHIEGCQSCRALLSQIKSMRQDLSSVGTGIEEGRIADAVMQSIKQQKTSVPFPKFKITHHLGTAAAIVIILVAALMIKNPQDIEKMDTASTENGTFAVYDDGAVTHRISAGAADRAEETADAEESAFTEADTDKTETGGDFGGSEHKKHRLLMKASRPVAENEAETEQAAAETENEVISEALYDTYNSAALMLDDASEDDITDDIPKEAVTEAVTEALTEATASDKAEANDTAAIMFKSAKREVYIFEGIEFLEGEENFKLNLSLINQRLFELYGEGYALSDEKLRGLGLDNERLLEIAPTVTQKDFDYYKLILDVFE